VLPWSATESGSGPARAAGNNRILSDTDDDLFATSLRRRKDVRVRAFEELTHRGQVRRLRRVAAQALARFGVEGADVRQLYHIENTTFRVDDPAADRAGGADGPYVPGRFLLRIHRPGYQNHPGIASELAWLAALRKETDLAVPEPVPTLDGAYTATVEVPGVPKPRVCSLLRWMDGRFCEKRPSPRHMRAVGRLMAGLHEHARAWKPPRRFVRARWDWDGLFVVAGSAGDSYEGGWKALELDVRKLFRSVSRRAARAMKEMGEGPNAFGLIHADLHLGNVLFAGGQARAIDFDDCGKGHWIYDHAVLLHDYRTRDNYLDLAEGLFQGYAEVRPIPADQFEHLETIMNARAVMLMLWAQTMTERNPFFRANIDRWMKRSVDYLGKYHRPK
jgi:Ser/Thr protein kinase RdoA (MazF antagonist)